jgi:hypothetical protein
VLDLPVHYVCKGKGSRHLQCCCKSHAAQKLHASPVASVLLGYQHGANLSSAIIYLTYCTNGSNVGSNGLQAEEHSLAGPLWQHLQGCYCPNFFPS